MDTEGPRWGQNDPSTHATWTQNGDPRPKMESSKTQNGVKMNPKWTQQGQDGGQNGQPGAPKPILIDLGRFSPISGRKAPWFLEVKMIPKSMKNVMKKTLISDTVPGCHFLPYGVQNDDQNRAGGHRNRYRNGVLFKTTVLRPR